jgi:ABC-type uncharacterized transport system substrate-binding protein
VRTKIFCLTFSAVVFMLNASVEAQEPKKVPRIGYLGETDPAMTEAFRQGLRDLGYVEGKNSVIEYRNQERAKIPLAELAADLVRLNVDVMVTGGEATFPVKTATSSIPIVFVNVGGDPVGLGLVTSFAHPGGNLTGVTNAAGSEIPGKRLELLKESFPTASRVAVLWNPDARNSVSYVKVMDRVARLLGIELQLLDIRKPADLEGAFSAIRTGRATALTVVPSNIIVNQLNRIVEFAAKSRLPGMYGDFRFVEAGGLMCYGASFPELYRRAATYIDKILKGAKPADLPVEQPVKFEFVINLKTAKQIGLTIPPNVLARADRVIK